VPDRIELMAVDPAHSVAGRRVAVDSILIFCLGLLAFTVAPSAEFIGLEARFALFAQTMLREGPSFFPRTYLGAYPDYPATATFLIYLPSRLWGQVTPLCAFLPTAIASSFILLITYRIAAIHSRLWGWYAVLLALLTQQFLAASRGISPDQYTSLVTALCFFWTYSAVLGGKNCPQWRLAAGLAAGFAFRGPIGLIIPAAVVCSVYVAQGDYRNLLRLSSAALVVLAACCGLLVLAAYHEGGTTFVQQVIKMQALGRLVGKARGPAFYWVNSFASYAVVYPLAVLVAAKCASQTWTRTRDPNELRLIRSVTIWAIVILLGLSIPGEKRTRYILPAVPAFALLASYIFVDALPSRAISWTRVALLRLCDWLPGIGLAVSLGAFALRSRFSPPFYPARLMTAVTVLALSAIAWTLLRTTRRVHANVWRVAVAAGTLVVVHVGVVETVTLSLEGAAAFVQEVAVRNAKAPGPIVFWRIGPDQEDIRFMVNYDTAEAPKFVSTVDDLFNCDRHAWLIAEEESLAQLAPDVARRFEVCVRGRIGHKDCVAFRFTDLH